VALSRCRTLEGMVLSSPLSARAVKTDRSVLRFTEHAGENIPTEEKLKAAKIRYQQQLLLDCFDFQPLQGLLGRLVSTVERNPDLVQILGAGDLRQLQQNSVNDICTVGANFRRQLQGLFTADSLPAEDPTVLERIHKASSYFQEKIQTHLGESIANLEVETDNKELRKKAKNICKWLQEETAVKLAAVVCCESGFSSSQYLKAVSSAELKITPKKEKKTEITYTEADVGHPELFQSLKDWRSQKAKDGNLAHFQVMHQKTLVQIAVNLPDSLQALMKIKGIGKKLAEKYGEELVNLVSTYRKKNKIEEVILPAPSEAQPEEPKENEGPKDPKTPKIPTRTLTLELFEQGETLSQIAGKRGVTLATVEKHLASCVEKGELAVDKMLSPEKRRIIEQKLQQMPDDKLRDVKQALDHGYSYGEINFAKAHLKFLVSDG
jgi:hypothetical protein